MGDNRPRPTLVAKSPASEFVLLPCLESSGVHAFRGDPRVLQASVHGQAPWRDCYKNWSGGWVDCDIPKIVSLLSHRRAWGGYSVGYGRFRPRLPDASIQCEKVARGALKKSRRGSQGRLCRAVGASRARPLPGAGGLRPIRGSRSGKFPARIARAGDRRLRLRAGSCGFTAEPRACAVFPAPRRRIGPPCTPA